MIKRLLVLLALSLIITSAFSQKWDWGEDIVMAKGKYNQIKIFVESNELNRARAPIQWLLANAPQLNVALYQKASKVYEKLAKTESDPKKLKAYQDTALWLYDKRMEYFGNNSFVLNLKGKIAWKIQSSDLSKRQELLDLYSRIYYLNGEETFPENFYYHFLTLCSLHESDTSITEEVLIEYYNSFSNRMDKQLAGAKSKNNRQRITFYKNNMDNSFSKYVKLDCDQLIEQYGREFDEEPTLELAKKIFNQLKRGKCYNSEYFVKTLTYILEKEPNASWYSVLGKYQLLKNKIEAAKNAYVKAIELTEDKTDKANWNLALAEIHRITGNYEGARNLAKKAANSNEVKKEAYKFIGDLYFYYSYNACKTEDPVQNKSIYIAAYEMYKRAGNSKMMREAKEYFPTMEEIFTRNYNVGDKYNTGCWINENILLQKK